MFIIGKDFRFEAAHSLDHLPSDHKCHRLHGHSYRLRVELKSPSLDGDGFVRDFGLLRFLKVYVDGTFDHRILNDVFGGESILTTAENLAFHFACYAERMLIDEGWIDRRRKIHAVTIWETPTSFARVEP